MLPWPALCPTSPSGLGSRPQLGAADLQFAASSFDEAILSREKDDERAARRKEDGAKRRLEEGGEGYSASRHASAVVGGRDWKRVG
jgi:hypothetical protein